jgi:hypothetical protein
MKIFVAVKQVPVRDAAVRISANGKWIGDDGSDFEFNEVFRGDPTSGGGAGIELDYCYRQTRNWSDFGGRRVRHCGLQRGEERLAEQVGFRPISKAGAAREESVLEG